MRNFVERTKVWENIQENDQENTETEIMERYDDVRCSDDRYDYDVCGIEWGNNVFCVSSCLQSITVNTQC